MSKLEDLVKVTKFVDNLEMMRVTSDIKIENDECVISFKHEFRKSEYVQVNFHDRPGSRFGSMIPYSKLQSGIWYRKSDFNYLFQKFEDFKNYLKRVKKYEQNNGNS